MAIRPEVLDELLQGTDAKQLFEKDGLLTELKKALAERVANYHRNTIRHFLWVIAAAGMNGPEDLKPEVLNRRVSLTEIRTYKELYPYLETGDLLEGRAPELYKKPWVMASAGSF